MPAESHKVNKAKAIAASAAPRAILQLDRPEAVGAIRALMNRVHQPRTLLVLGLNAGMAVSRYRLLLMPATSPTHFRLILDLALPHSFPS